jgi:hypothetical protein
MMYTSDALIEAIKRNAAVPTSQRKFSDLDILSFLNEELELTIVTELIKQQQDYFIERQNITLLPNVSEYDFPTKSVGWQVNAVGYVDPNGFYTKLSTLTMLRARNLLGFTLKTLRFI